MTDEFPSRTLDKIVIRAPDGMREALKDAAAANGRSLNAEIVQRLEYSLRAPLLPQDMISQIRVWAKESGRSPEAELLFRLEGSPTAAAEPPGMALVEQARLDRIETVLAAMARWNANQDVDALAEAIVKVDEMEVETYGRVVSGPNKTD